MYPIRHIQAVLSLGGLLFASSSAMAASARAPETLCSADETVLFSCHVDAKIASVCITTRTPKSQPGLDSMQYRFGKSKNELELAYPKELANSVNQFRYETDSGAQGPAHRLRFAIDAKKYTIVQEAIGLTNNAFISVETAQNKVALVCTDDGSDSQWQKLFGLRLHAPYDFSWQAPAHRPR